MQNLIDIEPFVEQVDRLVDNTEQLITPQLLRTVLNTMVSELNEQWYNNVFENMYGDVSVTILPEADITPSTGNTFQVQTNVPGALALVDLHPGDCYRISWSHENDDLKLFTVIDKRAWDGTSKKITPTYVYELVNGSRTYFGNTLENQGYAVEEGSMIICNDENDYDLLLVIHLDQNQRVTDTAKIESVNMAKLINDVNEEIISAVIPPYDDGRVVGGVTHYYYEKFPKQYKRWFFHSLASVI